MEREEKLIKVFAGTEAKALLLKARLEEAGISALVKNDSQDAFFGTAPAVVDLYIRNADRLKAAPLLEQEGLN
jgi:hypothetical protein